MFGVDHRARQALQGEMFGKRVPFSGKDQWPIRAVVSTCDFQSRVEAAFSQAKDLRVAAFAPMLQCTDQRIRAHPSYCAPALAVARLMVRETHPTESAATTREVLSKMRGIEDTVLHIQGVGTVRGLRLLVQDSATTWSPVSEGLHWDAAPLLRVRTEHSLAVRVDFIMPLR